MYRFHFILRIMLENVRAVLGDSHLCVRGRAHGDQSPPPEIKGERPEIFAAGGGVCIAADVALGEDLRREQNRQARIAQWVREGPSRHYWVGIPINYPMTRRQQQWQDEGVVTFHPFQI